MKDRIKKVMELENMTSGAFAESIGIQQSTLSHILKGRNNPSLDVVMKIHQRYGYINLEWLLYNKGEMSNDPEIAGFSPSLFNENALNPDESPEISEYRRENRVHSSENAHKSIVKQEVRYIEKPSRKITEIRIFFDDNTYEIFRPEK